MISIEEVPTKNILALQTVATQHLTETIGKYFVKCSCKTKCQTKKC